jgi:hypothetical protein
MCLFSKEELEMVEISLSQRFNRFQNAVNYFSEGIADGEIEECNDLQEALWQSSRYRRLYERVVALLEDCS